MVYPAISNTAYICLPTRYGHRLVQILHNTVYTNNLLTLALSYLPIVAELSTMCGLTLTRLSSGLLIVPANCSVCIATRNENPVYPVNQALIYLAYEVD